MIVKNGRISGKMGEAPIDALFRLAEKSLDPALPRYFSGGLDVDVVTDDTWHALFSHRDYSAIVDQGQDGRIELLQGLLGEMQARPDESTLAKIVDSMLAFNKRKASKATQITFIEGGVKIQGDPKIWGKLGLVLKDLQDPWWPIISHYENIGQGSYARRLPEKVTCDEYAKLDGKKALFFTPVKVHSGSLLCFLHAIQPFCVKPKKTPPISIKVDKVGPPRWAGFAYSVDGRVGRITSNEKYAPPTSGGSQQTLDHQRELIEAWARDDEPNLRERNYPSVVRRIDVMSTKPKDPNERFKSAKGARDARLRYGEHSMILAFSAGRFGDMYAPEAFDLQVGEEVAEDLDRDPEIRKIVAVLREGDDGWIRPSGLMVHKDCPMVLCKLTPRRRRKSPKDRR